MKRGTIVQEDQRHRGTRMERMAVEFEEKILKWKGTGSTEYTGKETLHPFSRQTITPEISAGIHPQIKNPNSTERYFTLFLFLPRTLPLQQQQQQDKENKRAFRYFWVLESNETSSLFCFSINFSVQFASFIARSEYPFANLSLNSPDLGIENHVVFLVFVNQIWGKKLKLLG